MKKVKTITISKSAYENNDLEADRLRGDLKNRGLFVVNVMSSPGAGKTTTLEGLIKLIGTKYKAGVIEADIDSDIDAVRISQSTGCRALQLHTGGMCHVDASMLRESIENLGEDDLDLIFLENVGNLVCPAEFDTGASLDMMILSVPEGDDKPLKYPLIFEKSRLVLINKTDTLGYFNFDVEKCTERIRMRNPSARVVTVSAKTGEGMESAASALVEFIENDRKEKGYARTE